ncbi:MAG: rRNA ((527)-N(7))-methyltransferase RsmG [Pseudomonadota bacterium]|jgi:16S rRNA (guanine527-N7)-methyltransferase
MAEREFLGLLEQAGLDSGQIERTARFRELVIEECSRQNLTKLVSPQDFFQGHVLDVLELRRFRERSGGSVSKRWMDLGTGAGVPGLLSAALFLDEQWLLVDSELRKAEFLSRAVDALGLSSRVTVIHSRAEKIREDEFPEVIVSRAVGSVEKIFSWLEVCSTWNSLVLLKGPRWDLEWAEFLRSRWRKHLEIESSHRYCVRDEVERVIIQLRRVPRGTRK